MPHRSTTSPLSLYESYIIGNEEMRIDKHAKPYNFINIFQCEMYR